MELKILTKNENELLGRIDVVVKVTFEGPTPSRKELKKVLVSQLKSKEDLTIVRKINTNYGGLTAEVLASVYKSKELFDKVEKDYLKKKNVIVEESSKDVEKVVDNKEEKKEDEKVENPKVKTEEPVVDKAEEKKGDE